MSKVFCSLKLWLNGLPMVTCGKGFYFYFLNVKRLVQIHKWQGIGEELPVILAVGAAPVEVPEISLSREI